MAGSGITLMTGLPVSMPALPNEQSNTGERCGIPLRLVLATLVLLVLVNKRKSYQATRRKIACLSGTKGELPSPHNRQVSRVH